MFLGLCLKDGLCCLSSGGGGDGSGVNGAGDGEGHRGVDGRAGSGCVTW